MVFIDHMHTRRIGLENPKSRRPKQDREAAGLPVAMVAIPFSALKHGIAVTSGGIRVIALPGERPF
jgi:hypothetical protein